MDRVGGGKQYYLEEIREDVWNDGRVGADKLQSSRIARRTCKPRGGTQVVKLQPRLIHMNSCIHDLIGKACHMLAEGGYES
jgi:hypothetical protein